jgi:DNA-binding helix-hairpin-helix protein with protein kinase domain
LGSGGQGEVYVVGYQGETKALKWYKRTLVRDGCQDFLKNLRKNVSKGSPSQEFVWPLDVVRREDGRFGYVMDLVPPEYHQASEFFLHNVWFAEYRRAVDACLVIVKSFRVLHDRGYSYQDINGGNFFINPQTGKVLICDNDNVAPNGVSTGIMGTPRFMAPEVVTRRSLPDVYSDRFSMSVLIFMLLCLNHPLEGRRSTFPALTPEIQERLYGSEPLFVMDPNDRSNAPDPKVHVNMIKIWDCLPSYMRAFFSRAFSQEALLEPRKRPTEADWMQVLARFRSDMVPCTCGSTVFTEDGAFARCDNCGRAVGGPVKLQIGNEYALPGVPGTRIYRCQTGICNAADALDRLAQVVSSSDGQRAGIMNTGNEPWDATTSKGVARAVQPKDVVPLKPGITIRMNDATVSMVSNQ